jgi:hypothetical protein
VEEMVTLKKEQSLLYDWHGKLVGEADWAEQSAKYEKKKKKKEKLNLMNGKLGRKEQNEQQGSK